MQGYVEVVLAMWREGIRLDLREDVEIVVVSSRNLREEIWMGRGVERGGRGGASKGGRGKGKKGRRVRCGSGERGGGRGEGGGGRGGYAGSGTEKRGEGKGTRPPVDARVVSGQPGEAQDHLEVTQTGDLKGEGLGMGAMDTEGGGKIVSDGASGGDAAINEF